MSYTDVSKALSLSDSDKQGGHQYGMIYNLLFNTAFIKFDRKINILEIGCSLFSYGSTLVFSELDIVNSVTGIDLHDLKDEDNHIKVIKTDAYDIETVNNIEKTGEKYDIIIDDGSHNPVDQFFFAEHYHRVVSPGGYLIIEDIYRPETKYKLARKYGFYIMDGHYNIKTAKPEVMFDEAIAIREY